MVYKKNTLLGHHISCVSRVVLWLIATYQHLPLWLGSFYHFPAQWLIEKEVPICEVGMKKAWVVIWCYHSKTTRVTCTAHRPRLWSRLAFLLTVISLQTYKQVLMISGLWLMRQNGLLPPLTTTTTPQQPRILKICMHRPGPIISEDLMAETEIVGLEESQEENAEDIRHEALPFT